MGAPGGRVRTVAALVVVTLLATGCGARLSADQVPGHGPRVAAAAGTATAAPGSAVASGAAPVAGEAITPTAAGPGVEAGAGTGTPAAGGATGTAGTADAAAASSTCTPVPGSREPGVSDDSIRLGNVSTIAGPVPGLAQTVVNGALAYVAYRNAVYGGVCGRRIDVITADDRLDAAQNHSQTLNMRDDVLGFAGSFSAVDDGGASVLAGTNIPDVSLSIGNARVALPNNFSPNPFDPTAGSNGQVGIFQYFMRTYGSVHGGVIWPAQTQARKKGQDFERDMQRAGLTQITTAEVALTESSFVSVAQQMHDEGVDLLVTALEIGMDSRLALAFKQIGWFPKVAYYGAQVYGGQWAQLTGDAGEGTLLALSFDPAEHLANPAVATMVDWYHRVNPGADIDTLAIEGWTGMAMMVRALEMAGGDPTRDKVLAALQTFHAYDADGLIAPIDAAGKQPPQCFLIVQMVHGQWVRSAPADTGFIC